MFFVCFLKTRKKFDKYIKVNKIRNKYIIDIKKMLEEEKIQANDPDAMAYFKVLVFKKIQIALEKKKDIYYIPNFSSLNFQINTLFKLKNLITVDDQFNLLLFFNEFSDQPLVQDYLIDNLSEFSNSQIIKDY